MNFISLHFRYGKSSLKIWGRLVLTAGSHDEISKSSAEIKLVNNMFQILNGENNYALAA